MGIAWIRRLIEAGRQSVLQETEERVDRGEPDVTSSRRVGARSLKMLQERQDERRIKPLDLNLRRFDFEPAGGEAEQQLEGLRIRLAGMLACSAFFGQMLAQETAPVRGGGGPGAAPIHTPRA